MQGFRHLCTVIFVAAAGVQATGIDRPVRNAKPLLALVLPRFVLCVCRLRRGQAMQGDANPIACLVQDGEMLIAGG